MRRKKNCKILCYNSTVPELRSRERYTKFRCTNRTTPSPSATAVFVGRRACFTCGRVLVVLGWLLGRFTFKIWVWELSYWMSYCNIGYVTMCIWPLFSYTPPLLCELVLAAIKIFSSKKFNYMNHRLRSIWQNLSSPNLDKIFFCNLSFKYHQTKNRYL